MRGREDRIWSQRAAATSAKSKMGVLNLFERGCGYALLRCVMGRLTQQRVVTVFFCCCSVFGFSQFLAAEPNESVATPVAEDVGQQAESSDQVQSDEESTVFDLYLSDDFKGAVVASYTDNWFEVDDPADAVSQLPEIKEGKAKLVELLTGRISNQRFVEGVGRVYIDLSTFRIIVVPDSSLLEGRTIALGQRRIGAPEEALSVHQTVGVAAFNQGLGPSLGNTSVFTHRGVASYGNLFLKTNGFLAQDQPYQLNEATAGSIVGDYQAQGGLLQMRGQSYIPSLRFAGVQFQTAEFLFLDNDAARGSKLEVFIPSRSSVRFYRDGQLISVQVLDFGLQEVDTSSFPQGSYDVTIVSTNTAGQETTEKRFFTKAGFLASRARPVMYFGGGVVRNLLELLDTPIAQGGLRMRISDYFDFDAVIAATNENSIASANVNGLYDVVRVNLDGAAGQSGDYGVGAGGGLTLLGFSVNGRVSKAEGVAQPVAELTPIPGVPNFVPSQALSPTQLVIQQQQSRALTVSRSVGPFEVRYNVQRNKLGDQFERHTRGPSVDWRILSETMSQLQMRLADFDTEQGRLRSAQLFYRYRFSQMWSLDAQLLKRWQDVNDEFLALLGSTYNSRPSSGAVGSQHQLTEEFRRIEGTSQTNDSTTTSLLSNATTDMFNLRAFARDSRASAGQENTVWGLNAESTFFVSNEGTIDVAHPPQSESVFVAEVEGNILSEDDEFDVIVNGQQQGTVSSRARGVISLMPYRSYKISLQASEKSGLVDYDAAVYEVTLFPGNVAKRVWKIDRVYVLLGKLVDSSGTPIARERVQGARGYGYTEDDGTFQLEVTGEERLVINSKRHQCFFDLDFPEMPEYFFDAGEVQCKPLSDEPKEVSDEGEAADIP